MVVLHAWHWSWSLSFDPYAWPLQTSLFSVSIKGHSGKRFKTRSTRDFGPFIRTPYWQTLDPNPRGLCFPPVILQMARGIRFQRHSNQFSLAVSHSCFSTSALMVRLGFTRLRGHAFEHVKRSIISIHNWPWAMIIQRFVKETQLNRETESLHDIGITQQTEQTGKESWNGKDYRWWIFVDNFENFEKTKF